MYTSRQGHPFFTLSKSLVRCVSHLHGYMIDNIPARLASALWLSASHAYWLQFLACVTHGQLSLCDVWISFSYAHHLCFLIAFFRPFHLTCLIASCIDGSIPTLFFFILPHTRVEATSATTPEVSMPPHLLYSPFGPMPCNEFPLFLCMRDRSRIRIRSRRAPFF